MIHSVAKQLGVPWDEAETGSGKGQAAPAVSAICPADKRTFPIAGEILFQDAHRGQITIVDLPFAPSHPPGSSL
jgi:hypothetical protein